MANYYVWLDSGHAKNTGGKRNTLANPAYYEWDWNNKVQYKLKDRLEDHGITVYLTNPNPATVSDIALTTRANIANNKWRSLGRPSNAIFISIHANAAGSCAQWANARGVEVYHASNASTQSKNLASLLTNRIYKDLYAIDNGFKNRGRKQADFTVIYKANMRAVLIEHGFYDNRADLNLMVNHMDRFVEADCKAICEYFGIAYKVPSVQNSTSQQNPQQSSQSNVNVPYIARITCDELNIRESDSFNSRVIGVLHKGDAYTIIQESNGLGKLKYEGWISVNEKYIDKLPVPQVTNSPIFKVRILCDELNIRKDADFNSPVVGVVHKGDVYTIVEEKNGLGRLKSGAGWISINSKYVQKI